jgi:hypothetical protein
MNEQAEFTFQAAPSENGYLRWMEVRRAAASDLARRLGLPLGHLVEVWLLGGIRLEGRLQLKEELMFVEEDQVRQLQFTVDHTPFFLREMESCVRLD